VTPPDLHDLLVLNYVIERKDATVLKGAIRGWFGFPSLAGTAASSCFTSIPL